MPHNQFDWWEVVTAYLLDGEKAVQANNVIDRVAVK